LALFNDITSKYARRYDDLTRSLLYIRYSVFFGNSDFTCNNQNLRQVQGIHGLAVVAYTPSQTSE